MLASEAHPNVSLASNGPNTPTTPGKQADSKLSNEVVELLTAVNRLSQGPAKETSSGVKRSRSSIYGVHALKNRSVNMVSSSNGTIRATRFPCKSVHPLNSVLGSGMPFVLITAANQGGSDGKQVSVETIRLPNAPKTYIQSGILSSNAPNGANPLGIYPLAITQKAASHPGESSSGENQPLKDSLRLGDRLNLYNTPFRAAVELNNSPISVDHARAILTSVNKLRNIVGSPVTTNVLRLNTGDQKASYDRKQRVMAGVNSPCISLTDFIVCRTAGREHSADGLTGYLGTGRILTPRRGTNAVNKMKLNVEDVSTVYDERTVLLQVKDMGKFSISNSDNSLPSVSQVLADAVLMICPDELFAQQQTLGPNADPDPQGLLDCTVVSRYEYLRDFLTTSQGIEISSEDATENDKDNKSTIIADLGAQYFEFSDDEYENDPDDEDDDDVNRKRSKPSSMEELTKKSGSKNQNKYSRIDNDMSFADESINCSLLFELEESSFYKRIVSYCGGGVSSEVGNNGKHKGIKKSQFSPFKHGYDSSIDTVKNLVRSGVDIDSLLSSIIPMDSTTNNEILNTDENQVSKSAEFAEAAAIFFESFPPRSSIALESRWDGFPLNLLSKPSSSAYMALDVSILPGDMDPQNHMLTSGLRMQLGTLCGLYDIFESWSMKDIVKPDILKSIMTRTKTLIELKNKLESSDDILNFQYPDSMNTNWDEETKEETETIKADLGQSFNMNENDEEMENLKVTIGEIMNSSNPVESSYAYLFPIMGESSRQPTTDIDSLPTIQRKSFLDSSERLVMFIQRVVFGLSKFRLSTQRLSKIEDLYLKLVRRLENILFKVESTSVKDTWLNTVESLYRKSFLLRKFYRIESQKIQTLIKKRLELILGLVFDMIMSNKMEPVIDRTNQTQIAKCIRELYKLRLQHTNKDATEGRQLLTNQFQFWATEGCIQAMTELYTFKLQRDYVDSIIDMHLATRTELDDWIQSMKMMTQTRITEFNYFIANNKKMESLKVLSPIKSNFLQSDDYLMLLSLYRLQTALEISLFIKNNIISLTSSILTPIVRDVMKRGIPSVTSSVTTMRKNPLISELTIQRDATNTDVLPFRYKVWAKRFSGPTCQQLIDLVSKNPLGPQNWTMYLSPKPNSSAENSSRHIQNQPLRSRIHCQGSIQMSGEIVLNADQNELTTNNGLLPDLDLHGKYMISIEHASKDSRSPVPQEGDISNNNNTRTKSPLEGYNNQQRIGYCDDDTCSAEFLSTNKIEMFDHDTKKMVLVNATSGTNERDDGMKSGEDIDQFGIDEKACCWRMIKAWTSVF